MPHRAAQFRLLLQLKHPRAHSGFGRNCYEIVDGPITAVSTEYSHDGRPRARSVHGVLDNSYYIGVVVNGQCTTVVVIDGDNFAEQREIRELNIRRPTSRPQLGSINSFNWLKLVLVHCTLPFFH